MTAKTTLRAVYLYILALLLSNHLEVSAQDFWYPLYGPYGGNILSFAEGPFGTLFVGTEGGGVFRSFDNGDEWEEANVGIPIDEGRSGYKIYSILVHTNSFIFIGTSKQGRIFRSSDGGDSWTQVYNSTIQTQTVTCFTSALNGAIIAGANGILKSTDNGDTWNNPLPSQTIRQIITCVNGDILAATTAGIFKSTDNGDTWFQSNNGLTNTNIYAIQKNSAGTVFCSAGIARSFKSTDHGNNWTEKDTVMPGSVTYCLTSNSSNHLYAGTSDGLYKSTNDGDTWTKDSLDNNLIRTLHFTDSDKLFVGTDHYGMYRYPDNGTRYENINSGLKNTFINAMTFNNNGDLFCATNGNKFYRTNNLGVSWIDLSDEVSVGMSPSKIISLITMPNGVMIAGTVMQGVYRSVNNGDDWDQILTGFSNPPTIYSLAIDKTGNLLAGSSGKLYKSVNQGLSWVSIDNSQIPHNIYDIAVNSSGHVFVATNPGGVFRSTNNGSSWTQVNNGLPYNVTYAIGIREDDHIFVTGEIGGIYRSTNNGDTWSSVYSAAMLATDMVINELGDVFVSSINSKGVLRSIDDGMTWQEINSGLYNYDTRCLCLSPNSSLLGGSEGTGVWLSLLPTGANHFGGSTNLGLPIQHGLPVLDIVVIHSNPQANQNINSDFPIENVMVTLQEINHPDISELLITLSHEGITDTLVYQPGINGANFLGTKFKDEALLELSQGTAPFTSSFKPMSPLSIFSGLEATGDWVITITDQVPANDGVFEAWSISILSNPSTDIEVENYIPNEFYLFQNYPNPFNPTTNIRFRISDFEFVTLKVYDILGNEFATLVDEYREAGSYEVEFDASGLASGLYLYRLQAEGYIETKKMILIK
jgi:photosystem II stability/assembly factor-like uncharacterized protein